MILILHYYKSMVEGVMTTMLDLYYNLRKFTDVKFSIVCPDIYLIDESDERNSIYQDFPDEIKYYKYKSDLINIDKLNEVEYNPNRNDITCNIPFLQYNHNFGDISLSKCIEKIPNKFEADTIVCSGRLLYEIINGANITLKYKKLLVIDSLDILKSKLGIFPNLDDAIDGKAIFFFFFSSIRNSKHEQKNYYIKLSEQRMKWLNFSNIVKKRKCNETIKYSRKNKMKIEIFPNRFVENIGKTIFENLYLGRKINYSPDGMFMKDGLFYYLNLFGINAWNEYIDLKIPPAKIKDKLFFSKADDILGYIE